MPLVVYSTHSFEGLTWFPSRVENLPSFCLKCNVWFIFSILKAVLQRDFGNDIEARWSTGKNEYITSMALGGDFWFIDRDVGCLIISHFSFLIILFDVYWIFSLIFINSLLIYENKNRKEMGKKYFFLLCFILQNCLWNSMYYHRFHQLLTPVDVFLILHTFTNLSIYIINKMYIILYPSLQIIYSSCVLAV